MLVTRAREASEQREVPVLRPERFTAATGGFMTVRDDLLALRARLDEILTSLPDDVKKTSERRYMTVPEFAELRGYSSRTIRDWCELGMPHSGDGKGRRIHVAEAIAWIEAGGPRRARMARNGDAA